VAPCTAWLQPGLARVEALWVSPRPAASVASPELGVPPERLVLRATSSSGRLARNLAACAFAIIGALLLLAAIAGTIQEGIEPGIFVGTVVFEAFFGGAAWFFYRAAVLRVEADRDAVTLVNYSGTRRIPWSEVQRVEAGEGSFGVEVVLWSGLRVKANGVTKGVGVRDRAAESVDALNRMRQPPRPDLPVFVLSVPPPPPRYG
jgi:hypothetical protein